MALTGCSLQQPLQQANQSQATVGQPAPDFVGTDLDGHPWEVAYNPSFPIAADGSSDSSTGHP